jgi:PiT family inorganic phosphate transporter
MVLSVLFLAYSNGANDNFKGVATLFGSGTCTYRTALIWATGTTLMGSLFALGVASGLVETFQGRGLVPDEAAMQPAFLLAVSLGGALTVILATGTGMPVSTTHALTGALLGAGLAAQGEIRLASLGRAFILPLLFSPVIALFLTILLYPLFRWIRRIPGVARRISLSVDTTAEIEMTPPQALGSVRTKVIPQTEHLPEQLERRQGRVFGLESGSMLDGLHFLSAGAVSFARGLNDTPKIVALLLVGGTLHPHLSLALIALAMAVGGVLNSRRVAETMSKKITRMNGEQGLTANLITTLLVTGASHAGLPVSTTHVAVGSLFGIGLVSGTARVRTIVTVLLAWVTTLPVGAALSSAIYLLLRAFGET